MYDDKNVELSGGEPDTTNNRMEMMAVIKSLKWLHKEFKQDDLQDLKIEIYSDSNLIIQTINKGWKKKANTDLWAEIDKLRAWLNITWNWVKAHHTNKYNNRADIIAFTAATKMKEKA